MNGNRKYMQLTDFLKVALPWDQNTGVYSMPQQVQWQRWLNGFFVHNTGTTLVIFGGDVIQPGDSKSFGGNWAELYEGRLDFSFQTQTPPPATITNQVRITQKFYLFPE